MTLDEFLTLRDGPRRPMGLFGPIGPIQVYRITVARPPAPRSRVRPYDPLDELSRHRLEAHRKAAEHDRVVARLRAAREATTRRTGH